MLEPVDPQSVEDDLITLQSEMARLRNENARLRHDIDVLNVALAQVEADADSDTLTPLPNSRRFIEELQKVINYVARYQSGAALLYVDVDDLKRINDRHGHRGGDAALMHVAEMLRAAICAKPLIVDGQQVSGSVSIGYTMIEGDDTVETALTRADAAMYALKRAQRSER